MNVDELVAPVPVCPLNSPSASTLDLCILSGQTRTSHPVYQPTMSFLDTRRDGREE